MLIVRCRIARLRREVARAIHHILVFGDQHTATGGCDDLIAVKRKYADDTKGAGRLLLARSAKRLCSIFDYWNLEPLTNRGDSFVVRALSVQIDDDDRTRKLACVRAIQKNLGQQ